MSLQLDDQLNTLLQRLGIPAEEIRSLDAAVLAIARRLAREGCVVVVKIDGERESNPCTVVISGGPLRDTPIRRDAADSVKAVVGATEVFLQVLSRGAAAP